MEMGELVVYRVEPNLYGAGMIDEIRNDGRIVVRFRDGTAEVFDVRELIDDAFRTPTPA